MKITLDTYIKNPMGGRTHMVREREMARDLYTNKFNALLMKTAGMFDFYIYKNDPDRYIFYVKIPSERTPDVVYDVVLDLYALDDVVKKSTKLSDYYVRFFSNDPNFNFTYAYSFRKDNLIVPELMSKMDPKSQKQPPTTTNPNTVIGYVKSIYLAYLFYQHRGYEQKALWYNAPKINFGEMKRNIMDTRKKLIQVDKLNKIYQATKGSSIHLGNIDDLENLDYRLRKLKTDQKSKKLLRKFIHNMYLLLRKLNMFLKLRK